MIALSFAFIIMLAGCTLGGVGQETATTDTPTTITPTPIEPPPCPEKPEELTADSAARFAVEFEKAYTARKALSGECHLHTLNGLPNPPSGATTVDDGYLYEFGVGEAYETTYSTGDSWYDVRYFVGNQSVYRIIGDESDEQLPDPRENRIPSRAHLKTMTNHS